MSAEGAAPGAENESVALLLSAYERWENMPPVVFGLRRQDAYTLVCGMQLLVRRPALGEPMRGLFESFGRALQEQVSDTADLYTMLELGWDVAHDVREPGDGGTVAPTDTTPGE